MSKLPSDFKQVTSVGGTSMGASNSFTSGQEPTTVVAGILPTSKASSSNGEVNQSVLSTKATVIGGTNMGK